MTKDDPKPADTLSETDLDRVQGGLTAQIDGVIGKGPMREDGSGKLTTQDKLLSYGHTTGVKSDDTPRG